MKNQRKKSVYNPTLEDFSVKYDINKDKRSVTFTVLAGEIAEFEEFIADHVIKHLANRIVFERGVKTNFVDDVEKVKKEISVELW